jgi:hypothetical protein
MLLELSEVKPSAQFSPPTQHNGEALTLSSAATSGSFIIVRYYGEETIAGPAVERFFVDVYFNQQGAEAFRVKVKIIQPPPPPPNLWQRISSSLSYIFRPAKPALVMP